MDFITKITYFESSSPHGGGYGQITIADAISLSYDLRKNKEGSYFVSFPSIRKEGGQEKKFIFPKSAQVYAYILEEVLKAREAANPSQDLTPNTIGRRQIAKDTTIQPLKKEEPVSSGRIKL